MKSRYIIILVIIFVLVVLGGCTLTIAGIGLLAENGKINKPDYTKQKTKMENYLKNHDHLQIVSGKVYISPKSTHGVHEGDYIGVFYDKRDPSLGIQISMDKDTGKIKDAFDEKTFKGRLLIFEALKKHKKGSLLNGFLGFTPNGIDGPSLISWGVNDNTLSFAVMKDKIDVDKELETDYEILKIADKVTKENSNYKDGIGTINVEYYETNTFDLNKYLSVYKKKGFYDVDEGNLPLSMNFTKSNVNKFVDGDFGYAKSVMEYQIYTNDKERSVLNKVVDLDGFKKAAMDNYNKENKKYAE